MLLFVNTTAERTERSALHGTGSFNVGLAVGRASVSNKLYKVSAFLFEILERVL